MSNTNHPARVVFLDTGTFPRDIIIRDLSFPHEFVFHERTSADEVAGRIVEADIVITNKVPLRRDALGLAPKLKMIAVAATGYDVIDLDACAEFGVTVSNIRNYAINTVPEHTFALILALRRSITAYRQSVAAGDWQRSGQFCYFDYPINDLSGSTLGIIGDGVLGRAVADLGRAFGMRVLFSSYKGVSGMGPLYTPFEEVLRQSDVITLHAPLTASSRNMIGAPEFALMDVRMPGKRGNEIALRMRSIPALKDIAIVMMTAFVMSEDEMEKMRQEYGIDHIINKPLPDFDRLHVVLHDIIDQKRKQQNS